METPWTFYVKLSALLVLISAAVTFHYVRHGFHRRTAEIERHVPAADVELGRQALKRYGCGGCHYIPGVPGAKGKVGPRLDQLFDKIYIAGVLPHSPQNLIVWIRDPREVDPRTAMPDLNVGQQDARDIAAYLYSLR